MKGPNLICHNSKNNILLKNVDITGNVCGEFVEFQINYSYENTGNEDVEAIYTFPISEETFLSGFEANIGGRLIKGFIEDKEEAERLIEEMEKEETNFLLEEFNANQFKIFIGKILKGEFINIKISYIQQLRYVNDKLKLVIPKLVEPMNIQNREKIMNDNDYSVYLNLLVEPFNEVDFISESHKITVEKGEKLLYKINLVEDRNVLDKDIVIYIKEKNLEETTGMVYENFKENENIIYLRFIPDIECDEKVKPGNYLFLMDISKSMEGEKLISEKNALQLCLRNLYKGDKFNIVAMGDKLHYFSDGDKVEYNDENLKLASKWIDQLKCEDDAVIFEGLKYALKDEKLGEENSILFFTDDIVDDEKEILDYVDKNCNESRIFTFGIDASVNTYFINKLARITYGKAAYINNKAQIEEAILKQFNRIRGLQITNIDIDWGEVKVEKTYPRTIEYMYDEEPFRIFAKVKGDVGGIITLRGLVGNRVIQRKINLNNLELEENINLIEKIWYKKRCESLEEKMRFERGALYESMKNKVITMSKKIGVLTSETSMLLMEEFYDPVLGVGLKKILPIKIKYDDYDDYDESCNFYYKNYVDYDSLDKNQILKLSNKELLKIIASHQFADGSFGDSINEDQVEKTELTSKIIIAFALAKEEINLYKNLINKSLNYVLENLLEDVNEYKGEDLILIYIALKLSIEKAIAKKDKKAKIESILNYIEKILEENKIDINTLEDNLKLLVENSPRENSMLDFLVQNSISNVL